MQKPDPQTTTTERYFIPIFVMAFSGIFGAFGIDMMGLHATSGAEMFADLMFVIMAGIIWAGAIAYMWKRKIP